MSNFPIGDTYGIEDLDRYNAECAKNWQFNLIALIVIVIIVTCRLANGAEYYCDPVNGLKTNPGTSDKPWPSLQATIAARLLYAVDMRVSKVKDGDTLRLMNGDHGSVQIQNLRLLSGLTIVAAEGHQPVISRFFLKNDDRFTVEGITFQGPPGASLYLCDMRTTDNLRFVNNRILSAENAESWNVEQWNKLGSRGLIYDGSNGFIANNSFRYLTWGMILGGRNLLCENNEIRYFTTDAVNLAFDQSTFRNNVISDRWGGLNNGDHSDGIQGYAMDGIPRPNCRIENNTVIESTGRFPTIPTWATDPPNSIQGICFFDGDWPGLIIRNNMVVVSNYHAISVYGPKDCLIENNTVVQQTNYVDIKGNPIRSWIGGFPMKVTGRLPSNFIVRRNIAPRILPDLGGTTYTDNVSLTDTKAYTKQPGNLFLGAVR